MSVIIDLRQEVKDSGDMHLLEALLAALVGERCVAVAFSYGDELTLHLGDPVPYRHPKLADEVRGTWILGARASGWSLLLNDPPVLIKSECLESEVSSQDIEEKARQLTGSTVVSVRIQPYPQPPPYPGVMLVVEFGDRSRLTVIPSGEPDDSDDPLPDWELFTPFHMYLRCGPGPVWSYLRSDVVPTAGG